MCGNLRKAPLLAHSLRRVHFAATPSIRVVQRLEYTAIVGDIRDPKNPNYGALGVTRDLRLSNFAYALIEELANECFARWKRASEDSRRLRVRGGAPQLLHSMGWGCGVGTDGMDVDDSNDEGM